jgi:hypothetical protein
LFATQVEGTGQADKCQWLRTRRARQITANEVFSNRTLVLVEELAGSGHAPLNQINIENALIEVSRSQYATGYHIPGNHPVCAVGLGLRRWARQLQRRGAQSRGAWQSWRAAGEPNLYMVIIELGGGTKVCMIPERSSPRSEPAKSQRILHGARSALRQMSVVKKARDGAPLSCHYARRAQTRG